MSAIATISRLTRRERTKTVSSPLSLPPRKRGYLFHSEANVKKELAIRIVQLNELIQEQEYQLQTQKETIKDMKERRDAFLAELVALVAEGE